jgi:hypothetical protein
VYYMVDGTTFYVLKYKRTKWIDQDGDCGSMCWGNDNINVKVKVALVQALRLCTGRTAHRGSRGIALPFHDHGTRRG